MPLTAQFSTQCPLLIESDFLSLSSTFVLRAPLLYDTTVGAAHRIAAPGEILIAALHNGITYQDLLELADSNTLQRATVVDLIGFLNLAGALQRKRKPNSYRHALKMLLISWVMGTRFAHLSWRRVATPRHLGLGLLRASWAVIAAATSVASLAILSGLTSFKLGLGVFACSTLLFLISVYVHELGHWLFLRKQATSSSDVLQRGLRLGLLHQQLEPSQEFYSAILGPALGLIPCIGLLAVGIVLNYPIIVIVSLVVGLVHIGSLLPWYGDGASVRYALAQMRNT